MWIWNYCKTLYILQLESFHLKQEDHPQLTADNFCIAALTDQWNRYLVQIGRLERPILEVGFHFLRRNGNRETHEFKTQFLNHFHNSTVACPFILPHGFLFSYTPVHWEFHTIYAWTVLEIFEAFSGITETAFSEGAEALRVKPKADFEGQTKLRPKLHPSE